jgi:hypothetical protein
MMAATAGSANVLIKLQLVGDRQVRAGMKATTDQVVKDGQRVTRESDKSSKAQEREAKRMRRSIVKETQRAYADMKRTRDKDARDAAKAEQQKARDAQKSAREQDKADADRAKKAMARRRSEVREIQRAYQQEQQQLRNQERQRRQARTIGERRFAAGVAGVGVLAGTAVSAARASQSVIGIRDQDAIVSDSIQARQALIAQVRAAGGSGAQADQIFNRTIATARSANVSPLEALQTVTKMNEQFSSLGTALQGGQQGLDDFFATLEGNAQLARASTDSTENVSMAMAALATQFGLTAEQQVEARGLLFQGAQEGALTMRDFGQLFPEVIAPFLAARGSEGAGLGGLREFTALGQTIQATTNNPSRTRTLIGAVLQNLSDVHVQERLGASTADGGLGISARNANGDLRSPAAIAHDMALMARSNPGLLTSTAYRSIFHDQEASAGFAALVQQDMRGNGALGRIGVDAATGNAGIATTSAALNADASGRAIALVNEREARVLANSEQLLQANIDVAEGLTHLEDEFPRLTMALERLAPLLQALVGAAALKAMLPGSFFSTLSGRMAPLAGTVFNPATGAAAGGMAGLGGGAGGAGVAAATTGAITLGGAAAAAGAGLAAFAGTVGLLDLAIKHMSRGNGIAAGAGGGSASQDIADFFSGNWSLAGETTTLRGALPSARSGRGAGFAKASKANRGLDGRSLDGFFDGQQRVQVAGRGVANGSATADQLRAQREGANQIVTAVREVATAVRQIPPPAPTPPSTGDTTTRGQQQ